MNLPVSSALIFRNEKSFKDYLYRYLLIEMYDATDLDARELLMDELYGVIPNKKVKIIDAQHDLEKNELIVVIINLIFDVIIAVTMFLCFFALSANMSANLYEQSKEIAVLRAIGLGKNKIKLLYFYEAIVLIFASCLLGIMIGVTVGYTMVA
jgi:ABC-type antimicrobial peptide transport system permease subunit